MAFEGHLQFTSNINSKEWALYLCSFRLHFLFAGMWGRLDIDGIDGIPTGIDDRDIGIGRDINIGI